MDILDTLEAEHRQVKKLLKELVDNEDSKLRTAVFADLRIALVKHTRAEERALYEPIAKADGRACEIEAKEGYIEHALVDTLLDQLKRARNKATTDWSARIKVLSELLEHHIGEEENDFFPSARKHFSAEERAQMNVSFESIKRKVKA